MGIKKKGSASEHYLLLVLKYVYVYSLINFIVRVVLISGLTFTK
jgi:hypothetical protein